MKRSGYLLLSVTVLLGACTNSYKKAKDGTQYKIISNNKGKKAVKGDFLELNIVAMYKDSILFSTYENAMPQYAPYDTAQFPPVYKEILRNIHGGDSIIVKILTDS